MTTGGGLRVGGGKIHFDPNRRLRAFPGTRSVVARSLIAVDCGLMTASMTPGKDWPRCLAATCPLVVAGPSRLEEPA